MDPADLAERYGEEPERVSPPEILLRGKRELRDVLEAPDIIRSDGGIPEQPRLERDPFRPGHRTPEAPELEIPEFLPFQGLQPLVPEHPESRISRCMACYLWCVILSTGGAICDGAG